MIFYKIGLYIKKNLLFRYLEIYNNLFQLKMEIFFRFQGSLMYE